MDTQVHIQHPSISMQLNKNLAKRPKETWNQGSEGHSPQERDYKAEAREEEATHNDSLGKFSLNVRPLRVIQHVFLSVSSQFIQ